MKTRKKTIKKVRAVIYDIKNNQPYFLILHRILRWCGWEFLKETIEPGETPLIALKRGIKEETKLKKFKIIKSLKYKERWRALGSIYLIVNTFLVKADRKQKLSLKQEVIEHDKYEWVDKKTALKKLTWPKTKTLLKKLNLNIF